MDDDTYKMESTRCVAGKKLIGTCNSQSKHFGVFQSKCYVFAMISTLHLSAFDMQIEGVIGYFIEKDL